MIDLGVPVQNHRRLTGVMPFVVFGMVFGMIPGMWGFLICEYFGDSLWAALGTAGVTAIYAIWWCYELVEPVDEQKGKQDAGTAHPN